VLDISERKRTEFALVRQQKIVAKALSIETVGIIFFDMKGHLTHANHAFERMSGYTLAELQAMDWIKLTAPEFQELTKHAATNIKHSGTTPPYEKQMICRNGG